MHKRFSQACENNQAPILAELQEVLVDSQCVLEIGSGTGQHAVYFAPRLPELVWQPSDHEDNFASILAWQTDLPSDNLRSPVPFLIGRDP
jgi:hypothetical protein